MLIFHIVAFLFFPASWISKAAFCVATPIKEAVCAHSAAILNTFYRNQVILWDVWQLKLVPLLFPRKRSSAARNPTLFQVSYLAQSHKEAAGIRRHVSNKGYKATEMSSSQANPQSCMSTAARCMLIKSVFVWHFRFFLCVLITPYYVVPFVVCFTDWIIIGFRFMVNAALSWLLPALLHYLLFINRGWLWSHIGLFKAKINSVN